MLHESGADLNLQDKNGNIPLHHAVAMGLANVVGYLIDNGSMVNLQGRYDSKSRMLPPLFRTLKPLAMDLFMRGQINIYHPHYLLLGLTPLHIAAANGQSSIIQHLVQSGADINMTINTFFPLHLAVLSQNCSAVKTFINLGADLLCEAQSKATPLDLAVTLGNAEVIRILLGPGADPLSAFYVHQDLRPHTMNFALERGSLEVLRLLMVARACQLLAFDECLPSFSVPRYGSKKEPSDSYMSFLDRVSAYNRHLHVLADQDELGTVSNTSQLFYAIFANTTLMVQLLYNGANVNAADRSGHTPLSYAVILCESEEPARVLLHYGADPNVRYKVTYDNSDWTPLRSAVLFDRPRTGNALFAAGARISDPQLLPVSEDHELPWREMQLALETRRRDCPF